ncbi:hypothetical protein EGW08_015580 [Elysia chlorotica]|uniref:Uncharacterized protein n=1 Tax=Elysia chlorotica TaxID=188477 RepID=A0A433T554_ELYCH|nr:hypothetical protein EGW08_015580 [Elysia chlorotica]
MSSSSETHVHRSYSPDGPSATTISTDHQLRWTNPYPHPGTEIDHRQDPKTLLEQQQQLLLSHPSLHQHHHFHHHFYRHQLMLGDDNTSHNDPPSSDTEAKSPSSTSSSRNRDIPASPSTITHGATYHQNRPKRPSDPSHDKHTDATDSSRTAKPSYKAHSTKTSDLRNSSSTSPEHHPYLSRRRPSFPESLPERGVFSGNELESMEMMLHGLKSPKNQGGRDKHKS